MKSSLIINYSSLKASIGLTLDAFFAGIYPAITPEKISNNVAPIAAIEDIYELNIGHSIIAQSVFSGLEKAVRDMKQIMLDARR
mgnify:CR=1 FL=1